MFSSLHVKIVFHARRISRAEVAGHATAQRLARQITEAFPWDFAPVWPARDNDGAHGPRFRRRLRAMGIRDRPITPYSPWQNGYVERVIGSTRRECLDHVIVRGVDHPRPLPRAYAEYYNNDRTHLGLGKDAPNFRPIEAEGIIASRPVLGGLHHRYGRAARRCVFGRDSDRRHNGGTGNRTPFFSSMAIAFALDAAASGNAAALTSPTCR